MAFGHFTKKIKLNLLVHAVNFYEIVECVLIFRYKRGTDRKNKSKNIDIINSLVMKRKGKKNISKVSV